MKMKKKGSLAESRKKIAKKWRNLDRQWHLSRARGDDITSDIIMEKQFGLDDLMKAFGQQGYPDYYNY